MIAYQKEKIENAICFFASEHKKRTKKPLYQIFLYKYLAFLDFKSLEETGHPALGLKYLAMEKGPVPIEIYEARKFLSTDCYEFKNIEENKFIIVSKAQPNLDYFSPYEIGKMRELIEIYADSFVTASDVSQTSHEIKAWQKAWKKKPNSVIDFGLAFDNDIEKKDPRNLSAAEENFLIYKATENPNN